MVPVDKTAKTRVLVTKWLWGVAVVPRPMSWLVAMAAQVAAARVVIKPWTLIQLALHCSCLSLATMGVWVGWIKKLKSRPVVAVVAPRMMALKPMPRKMEALVAPVDRVCVPAAQCCRSGWMWLPQAALPVAVVEPRMRSAPKWTEPGPAESVAVDKARNRPWVESMTLLRPV